MIVACQTEETRRVRYELRGTVLDDFDSVPIPSARVLFVSDTGYEQRASTDEDGEYEMYIESDVPFGQVRAERSGYAPSEQTVFFDTPLREIHLRLRKL